MEHENSSHYEHHESRESSHEKKDMTEKIRTNPWIISTFVLGILGIILIITSLPIAGITGNVISEDEAGELALDFANNNLLPTAGTLDSVKSINGIYQVNINVDEKTLPLYFTKDGSFIYQGQALVPLNTKKITSNTSSDTQTTPQEIPKVDVPTVELFIMTHCPYGTQAEKGFIPAIKTLGNTVDAKIRFIHYFMHEPEETETPRQVCIREEQSDKFLDYLGCFLEDGDSDRCITETGIDKSKLDSCVQNKAEDYYEIDSELSQDLSKKKGGSIGSPTLLINGVLLESIRESDGWYYYLDFGEGTKKIKALRDSSSYQSLICQAFNEAPEECGEELSTASPSPMWGYEEGQDTGAQC